jgi:hypothetical protein
MFYLLKETELWNNVGDTVDVSVSAGTYKLCSVLTSAGAKATGTAKVAYLVMEGGDVGKTIPSGGGEILVTRVNSDMVFETELGKAGSTKPAVGAKVSIFTDSLTVDASTEGNVEVVEAPETNTAGAKLRVKFI